MKGLDQELTRFVDEKMTEISGLFSEEGFNSEKLVSKIEEAKNESKKLKSKNKARYLEIFLEHIAYIYMKNESLDGFCYLLNDEISSSFSKTLNNKACDGLTDVEIATDCEDDTIFESSVITEIYFDIVLTVIKKFQAIDKLKYSQKMKIFLAKYFDRLDLEL